MSAPRIIYTKTDEAPALATRSLLPIIRAYVEPAGITVEERDISLAGRILCSFPEYLDEAQRIDDALAGLGELVLNPDANIIKLPNISASMPQLTECIAELQDHGYAVPDYPEEPANQKERDIHQQYAKILGSAVNPVLREGNSDRRVAGPVKQYAKDNPHSMGDWSSDSKTHVAHMTDGDFYGSEKSYIMPAAGSIRIELVESDGKTTILKDSLALLEGEVIDAMVMDCGKLRTFLAQQMDDALAQDVLFSIHLKATMMKVSAPIIFGHCVSVFYKDVFEKYADVFDRIGVNPNNGVGDILKRIESLPADQQAAIKDDIDATYAKRPRMAMVDSDHGITNLHVPSDVIIDASMPAMIRTSGQMWGPDGKQHDTKCVIPDRSYAGVYQEVITFCKQNGAFDPAKMGNISNVGLMAQKAEEYGSHDKTFEIPAAGTVRVVDESGKSIFEHSVNKGDIWRMCQTKDLPIRDWVKLAVARGRAAGAAVVFWLDSKRGHDASLIEKVNRYLPDCDTSGLDIQILAPNDAARLSCERAGAGKDTISVTGNVLRDYLTDLFPILELGTSAKMLSIVPLLAGGGLYETGAGGSAPKHVQQFEKESHLRWDSLGEFLALAVSLEDLGEKTGNKTATLLGETLNTGIGTWLNENKSPSRKVNEIDNRGSHFYLALYWAQALAAQTQDSDLQSRFKDVAKQLAEKEEMIAAELIDCQGEPADIGGYYDPDLEKADRAMRPSKTFNRIIDSLLVGAA